MKINNIFIGGLIAMVAFSSCSEEVVVDGPVQTGLFSIAFSVDAIKTKAGDQETEQATAKELEVNSCFIGFFEMNSEGTPGAMIQKIAISKGNSNFENTSERNFAVRNIEVPVDKVLKIMVVANPPQGSNYEAKTSYSDFRDVKIQTSIDDMFSQAVPLVKVGETTHVFSSTSTTASVELKQLAAKVKLTLTMQEVSSTMIKGVEVNGLDVVDIFNRISSGNGEPTKLIEELGLQNYLRVCSDEKNHDHSKYIDLEGKEQEAKGNNKWLTINNCDSIQKRVATTWTLTGQTIVVNNVAITTPLLFVANPDPTTGQHILSTGFNKDVLEFTFYTYRKELLPNQVNAGEVDNRLNVHISGNLQQILSTDSRKKTGGKIHGIWANSSGQVADGWGNGQFILPALNGGIDFSGANWGEWTPGSSTSEGASIPNQSYTAYINPAKNANAGIYTDGLVQGNYYEVKGIVKVDGAVPVTSTVEWMVITPGKIDITVPDFE